jgi:hypothetical protein
MNLTIPRVKLEMLNADYWIAKLPAPDTIIMTGPEIAAFNALSCTKISAALKDLTAYPETITKETLVSYLNAAKIPTGKTYRNSTDVQHGYRSKNASSWFYAKLKRQINQSNIPPVHFIQYGFTVRRTEARAFPTNERIFNSAGDIEFDDFQVSAIDPAEPLIIFHTSRNRRWFYILTANFRGWLPAADIAVANSRVEWLAYINEPDFLIVTDPQVRLNPNPFTPEVSELLFEMGAKIPLAPSGDMPGVIGNQSTDANYVVKLPFRGPEGKLQFKTALLPVNTGVNTGYLPYTRANILRQAFKMLGQRYGWGGMFNRMDCSAFVLNVYRSFGFKLPRNTEDQLTIPAKTFELQSSSFADSMIRLNALLPGANLHFPGHIMLYLGQDNGNAYIIHDLAAHCDPNNKSADGTLQRLNVNQVVVSDLQLTRKSGKQYWECLNVGVQIGN